MVPQGKGLYLKPYRGTGVGSYDDGLYIKSGTGFVYGREFYSAKIILYQMLSKIYPFLGPS